MKLLLSADLHGNHGAYRWLAETARARSMPLVLAGDLLGCPDGFETVEAAQTSDAGEIFALLSESGVPVYYIWGNDDFVDFRSPHRNVECIHERRVELGHWNLVGYQHSPPFIGGPHERAEEVIAADLEAMRPLVNSQTVLVTHSPAYGVLDTGILDVHAGSPAILETVVQSGPRAHVHGHIHSCFGVQAPHFNVAASGRNRAIILDLETLESQILEGEPPA